MLQFQLFTADPAEAQRAEAAGIERVVVDLEHRGKQSRQHGYHLETNRNTVRHVEQIRTVLTKTALLVRVNPVNADSGEEVSRVLAAGADLIILPMFERVVEVKAWLTLLRNKCPVQLLFETAAAIKQIDDFASLDFAEGYVGLNDLSLELGYGFCYQVLQGGMLDHVALALRGKPWGFGGATVIDGGVPFASRHIINEMARLGATRVILRRAFRRDAAERDWRGELERIRAHYDRACTRSAAEIEDDFQEARAALVQAVRECRVARQLAGTPHADEMAEST